MPCVKDTGSLTFDPTRILSAERIASARQNIRGTSTPKSQLARKVGKLFRLCLTRLPKAFDDNKVKMEAFIELPRVYPLDVINAVKARFERAGFVVEYTFSDGEIEYDHLGFTPPADWIERLLRMTEEDESRLDRAVQSLVAP